MPRHVEKRVLPYTREQLFDLVADVGAYPQFLPWVMGCRVRSRTPELLVADLMVGFKVFRETFTSKVTLDRPNRIHVDYVNGPLKYLHNDWTFTEAGEKATAIDFFVDFEFKNRLFESMAGAVFHEAVKRMVTAFEKRAAAVYGAGGDSSGINKSSATRTA
ncbi:type II toxin-antitoxin system RatA family toxin [Pedomonas mirosovicensis]|uniref:type II toxin-antitoxin system RatA family toxin n=1 Tax=Pedomonas mirosovicensis TaxID=2908641 RepID=UPI00216A5036|nr:type II toxin-antitoxin system RatA family toxin [Pedomonas mirosovicensis]MCH8685252.1 type II toxin-antitoxin system RatA family toxin [Pedomonas mirosovicensis]